MKQLIRFLFVIIFLSACGGSQRRGESIDSTTIVADSEISDIKMLTAEETEKVDRKNFKTITINYGSDVDLEKEIAAKDYYAILSRMGNQISDEKVFEGLKKIYSEIIEKDPNKLIKIPQVVTASDCGGCGCATPGKAGYALCVGNTCWCACCPK